MLPLQVPTWDLGPYGGFVRDGITVLVAFIVVYLLGRFVLVPGVRRALASRGYQEQLLDFAERLARIAVVAVAVAVAFTLAGYGAVLSAVAILGGALALAVGFGAQDLIANFVAGVFLLRDQPFVAGDWIEWDDKRGEVTEVDLRVTRLRTFDNELLTVPNSELANTAITNPVAKGTLRLRETFGVGYDDDIDRAREVLIEEARDHPDLLNEPEPSVRLVELGDSAVGIESRIWVRDPTAAAVARVRSEYVQAVKERFDEEGIDMPYPHTELSGGIGVEERRPPAGEGEGEGHDPDADANEPRDGETTD